MMKSIKFIIILLLLVSYHIYSQEYTLIIKGSIRNAGKCGNKKGLLRITLFYEKGSPKIIHDTKNYTGSYYFEQTFQENNRVVAVEFKTQRREDTKIDCRGDEVNKTVSLPSKCFYRNFPISELYAGRLKGSVYMSLYPNVNLKFNKDISTSNIYSVCQDDSVGIDATSGFTPKNSIYNWEFLDPVNTATQNVPAYQALLDEVRRLENFLNTCVQYLTSQYGPGAASSCYMELNQARNRLREYENSGLPLTMQVPVWRPILNKTGQSSIALKLGDLYSDPSDQNSAINKNIAIRLNPGCNADNAITNLLTVQFLPASPSVTRAPQIAPLNCSYSTTAGFRLFFDRQVNNNEAVAINLLRKLDNDDSYVPYDNNIGILSFNKVNGNTYTYDWKTGTGKEIKQGAYRIQVSGYKRGGNSTVPFCEIYEYDFNVTAPPPVDFNLVHIQDQNCYGIADGVIKLEVTSGGAGAYEYSLNDGSSWTSFTGANTEVRNLAPGTYEVQLRNNNGCFARNPDETIKTIEIIINPAEEITHQTGAIVPPSSPGAGDGILSVDLVNGGTPFRTEGSGREYYKAAILVNGVTINTTAYATGFDIDGLPAGIHSIQYEDANGCVMTKNLPELLDPLPITFTVQKKDPGCFDAEDGNLTLVDLQGGYPPYTISWIKDNLPYGMGESVTGSQGNYEVIITDNRSVQANQIDIRFDNLPLQLAITETLTRPTCYEGCDGSIALSIDGGTPPYSYEWNSGDSTNILMDICAGTYTVDITDANGCQTTKEIVLDNPEEVVLNFGNHYTVCKGEVITLDANIEDPDAVYQWTSTDGFTSSAPSVTINEPSTYKVIITDSKGCLIIKEVILDNFEDIILDLGDDITLCKDQSIELNATIPDSSATYMWTSSNGFSSNSGIIELNESGLYEVVVTDANGCILTDSVYIDKTSDPISSHFFASTQVYAGEKFIVVDNSDPIPEAVDWIFPDEAEVIFTDNDYAEAVFNTPGEYEISLRTHIGLCKEISTKKVIVIEKEFDDELTPDDDETLGTMIDYLIYPNPTNTGEFMISVNLSKPEDISIKIYNMINNTLIDSRKGQERKTYEFEYNLPLSSGIYFILVETSASSEVRKLIVK